MTTPRTKYDLFRDLIRPERGLPTLGQPIASPLPVPAVRQPFQTKVQPR